MIDFIFNILEFICILVPLLVMVAFLTHLERKLISSIQRRKGPNVVGFGGLLQAIADGVKLFLKESIIPNLSNKILFLLAPVFTFAISLLIWTVFPFNSYQKICDINLGFLFVLAVSSTMVYGIIIAGWSSNSKYAFLGSLRSTAQMISYEVCMGLNLLSVFAFVGSFNLGDVVAFQFLGIFNGMFGNWIFLTAFFIHLICMLAETNRPPFDLPESESELVSGYNVEYGGMIFSLFFLAEYGNLIFMSGFTVIMFFGGWNSPFSFLYGYNAIIDEIMRNTPNLDIFWFTSKTLLFLYFFIFVRATLPRYRYDQLMNLCWKKLLPLTLFQFIICAFLVSYFYIPQEEVIIPFPDQLANLNFVKSGDIYAFAKQIEKFKIVINELFQHLQAMTMNANQLQDYVFEETFKQQEAIVDLDKFIIFLKEKGFIDQLDLLLSDVTKSDKHNFIRKIINMSNEEFLATYNKEVFTMTEEQKQLFLKKIAVGEKPFKLNDLLVSDSKKPNDTVAKADSQDIDCEGGILQLKLKKISLETLKNFDSMIARINFSILGTTFNKWNGDASGSQYYYYLLSNLKIIHSVNYLFSHLIFSYELNSIKSYGLLNEVEFKLVDVRLTSEELAFYQRVKEITNICIFEEFRKQLIFNPDYISGLKETENFRYLINHQFSISKDNEFVLDAQVMSESEHEKWLFMEMQRYLDMIFPSSFREYLFKKQPPAIQYARDLKYIRQRREEDIAPLKEARTYYELYIASLRLILKRAARTQHYIKYRFRTLHRLYKRILHKRRFWRRRGGKIIFHTLQVVVVTFCVLHALGW